MVSTLELTSEDVKSGGSDKAVKSEPKPRTKILFNNQAVATITGVDIDDKSTVFMKVNAKRFKRAKKYERNNPKNGATELEPCSLKDIIEDKKVLDAEKCYFEFTSQSSNPTTKVVMITRQTIMFRSEQCELLTFDD